MQFRIVGAAVGERRANGIIMTRYMRAYTVRFNWYYLANQISFNVLKLFFSELLCSTSLE